MSVSTAAINPSKPSGPVGSSFRTILRKSSNWLSTVVIGPAISTRGGRFSKLSPQDAARNVPGILILKELNLTDRSELLAQKNSKSQWSVEKKPRVADAMTLDDFSETFAYGLSKCARILRSGDRLASGRHRCHEREQPRRVSCAGDVSQHVLATITAYVEA